MVKTGVEVDTGDGSGGDLTGEVTLKSNTYNYRSVSADTVWIDGDVTINCQYTFRPSVIIGVFHPDAPPPRVRINAGHPITYPYPTEHHRLLLWMTPYPWTGSPEDRVLNLDGSGTDGGIVEFYTSQAGDINFGDASVHGGDGMNGGRGGDGGEVVVIATGGVVHVINQISARGGYGGRPISPDGSTWTPFDGGQGGDGGRILLSGQGVGANALPGGLGLWADGGWGDWGGSPTDAHRKGFGGGAGGNGGAIAINGQLIGPGSFVASATGGRGGWGGDGKGGINGSQGAPSGGPGYPGGRGGDGGAPGVLVGIAGAHSPGGGGDGGDGGQGGQGQDAPSGSPGGPGGNGGWGGMGGNSGGDGAQPGSGGSGGLGGFGGSGDPPGQDGGRGWWGLPGKTAHPASIRPLVDGAQSHYLYILTVGVSHETITPTGVRAILSGDVAALRVRDAFLALPKLAMTAKAITLSGNSPFDNREVIHRAINVAASRLNPGDTFFLYVDSHAFPDPSGNDLLVISDNRGYWLSDDQLTGWFRGDQWNEVYKVFILDTCEAEAFWKSDPGDQGDLESLPRAAIIGAAHEGQNSTFGWPKDDPTGPGWGRLGQAVVGALDGLKNRTSITFDDLAQEVKKVGEETWKYYLDHNINGRMLGVEEDWGTEVPEVWNPVVAGTADFAMTLAADAGVTLTVTKDGAGTVTSNPAGILCGSDCVEAYVANTLVTLTATPTTHATFTGWAGDCTGTSPCTLTMALARTVTATFTNPTHTLTVTRAGPGSGTLASSPSGLTCGAGRSDCAGSFTEDTPVTLTPTPASGSVFTGWSGDCLGTGTCVVTMTQDRNVTATFALATYPLSISIGGSSAGSVTTTPGGLTCTGACEATYTGGTVVTLTASTGADGTFREWRGACSGTSNPCQVAMSGARTVTAVFSKTFPDTLTARTTPIKAAHFTELRSAIDTLRSHYALGAFAWTDTLSAGATPIKRQHLVDLRTALDQGYSAAAKAHAAYTDPSITARVTAIKAAHLLELRTFVRGLE